MNFYPALRALGHEIVESQVDLQPTSRFMDIPGNFTREELEVRAETTQRLLDEIDTAHAVAPIHLVLTYFYNAHFDPAGFDVLRQRCIPSVNFFCNSIHQFELVAAVAARADFSWHTEKHVRDRYTAAGANPIWIRMGGDPEAYRPHSGGTPIDKVCFIGQRYADRDRWLAALVAAGLPVDIYGAGWGTDETPADTTDTSIHLGRRRPPPGSGASYWTAARETLRSDGLPRGAARVARQARYRRETRRLQRVLQPFAHGSLAFERIPEVYANYAVSLNFSHVWSDGRPCSPLVPQIRLRDIEAPMAGACYLTGHSDELADYYDIGCEVDTYATEDELIDKTKFYLANRAAGDRLRVAGHARARKDHIWQNRFAELLEKTGLRTQ